jgi:hypothetical protein
MTDENRYSLAFVITASWEFNRLKGNDLFRKKGGCLFEHEIGGSLTIDIFGIKLNVKMFNLTPSLCGMQQM